MRMTPNIRHKLSRLVLWDLEDQVLWVDLREVASQKTVWRLPSWDQMMMSSESIPLYPPDLDLLNWPAHSDLRFWLQQMPAWVVESCRLFPTHQLDLLHYSGRYPQMLELLDHSPMLAWQLVKSPLSEDERVALFQSKRTEMVAKLGWSGKAETVKFLRNLRLRMVNHELLEQVEICLLDEQRLDALQTLPRINSMALSLAARFPELIGQRLHQSLARLPCRPMQCQAMVALLEDVYRLAAHIKIESVAQKIGDCRYLVEVEHLYQAWLLDYAPIVSVPGLVLDAQPTKLTDLNQWTALSLAQNQAWWLEFNEPNIQLWAWQYQEDLVGALVEITADNKTKLLRLRQGNNQLASAALQTQVELWLISHTR